MSHASIFAVWTKLERRTDLATTLRDAVGQYALQVASGVDSRFASQSFHAFNRLVNLIKIGFHVQRTYLQPRSPSTVVRQYLLEPTLVFELLAFLLTIKDRCLQSLGYRHTITNEVLSSMGGALLSGLRLLTLLKTKARTIEDYDWITQAELLKSRLGNWPLEDTFHRFLIQELCIRFLEGLSISVDAQLTENVSAPCGYHELQPDPGSLLDLPDFDDGLVSIYHSRCQLRRVKLIEYSFR